MDESLFQGWKAGRTRLTRGKNAGEYFPTWQVGQSQPQPSDFRTYAEDGYGKNSLIYSCIKEKATSFASLVPQIVRSDGTVMAGHRLVQLLANPNGYQDGQDFAELAKTQFEAGGNVYIKKNRLPSPGRVQEFGTFPVTALELIRPDYVTISPGRQREDDIFVVTVGGTVRDRIPRESIIHIHEPHLTNDFYGLAKIALLQREGAIDLQMSDFELAFFRNAGVPMGMLQVKGTMSQDQTDEVKSRFRKAYNGLKKWFELMVINADEATYTAMGMKNSDMEMDGTRFHTESRICSVFGVPGIIVGARYAMQAGAQLPYEEAEHSFWAETMVPDAMRFARAYQKFLLPEFATTRDRGAIVTYDFTQVRALQEDRSRKLREVVRLVLTGGFTVNQSLLAVGMEALAGADFYVRNGNQVIVTLDGEITPMTEGGGGPNLDNPLEGAALLRQLETAHTR